MKGERFKPYGRAGYARLIWEPKAPNDKLKAFIPIWLDYHFTKHGVAWGRICLDRYDWMMGELVKLGVNLKHFGPDSKSVPKSKCLEIAKALKKLRGLGEDGHSEHLLENDILFFGHCGGIKVHGWKLQGEF